MKIGILDYSSGNIASVFNACNYLGYQPCVISAATQISVDRLIIPGVGSAYTAMRSILDYSLRPYIFELHNSSVPIIGICLGFQLLFSELFEGGLCTGLSFFQGTVTSLHDFLPDYQIPRIGWSTVNPYGYSSPSSSEFYFLHSYFVTADTSQFSYHETSYIGNLPYLVACSSKARLISGFQYHPEKSNIWGLEVLRETLINGYYQPIIT